MKKRYRIILLTAVSLLLLTLASGLLFQNETNVRDDSSARVRNIEQQPRILEGNREKRPHMVEINNVEQGYKLKNRLDNQAEVTHFHHTEHETSHYYDHEAAVDFTKEPTRQEIKQITADINGKVLKQRDSTYIFKSSSLETREMLDYFNRRPNVSFAEPHYILMQNDISMPNDQLYQERYQWNLPAIGTEQGWEISRGTEDIKIAIVDTGVDLDHPDLENRLVDGYNVIEDSDNPDDDNGHGTHVAGIIASETNNREGTAGVTWYNQIMPVKAMGAKGYGTTFDIAKGIVWAVDHGADVINLSLGNYQESNVLKQAIRYAFKKDVVMIAAAGNDSSNQPSFPSAYPEVLSVSAIDYDGKRASFSNYGDYVDIAAPGVYIPSTYYQKQYAALSGTSMAAPHVSGLAGLIKSANPDLSNKEVMSIIQKSAIDLGRKGKDIEFGNGLIDVNQALEDAQESKSVRGRIREGLGILK
ncbi:S8 family peptidase [Mesobacillus foraminis]|uniref:Type VII secretion-associated serine protease mycosin n=1 Tax=Mesobacillus foraminis TaxID=279826 RepID=A0A4R2BHE3_9BACI|nr:S8 family peptidase [Mesobacillus foraminis]TCN25973.1 type VII secretion-associated serine protease mycosin [Mesobacillus foraminis]